ncbi:MAG: DegT/DnrJ/EryC1/StrS family aminotransferase [Thermoprotei archaeon]|nr:DegT/DnrJ/EryC1/StrS family aminotransferase [Thermoprotei archaeon]
MIPINKPVLGREEIEAVTRVLESGILTNPSPQGGPMVRRFEEVFARFIGVKHAIAVNSGTAALYAALLAAGIGPGDEVIVPAFTFVATANVVLMVGAKPVFVDIDLTTYNIDVEAVRRKITDRTRAIIPVHLYGLPADMDPLMELAEEHDLIVIEDACQAHGSAYKGKKAGSLGHMAAFSFYPSKIITTGEGGMVTTNDDELAEKLRMIRTHGQIKGYDTVILGANLRMTEIAAAIGVVQMERISEFLRMRRRNASLLTEKLEENEEIILPSEPKEFTHNWYLYTIRVNKHNRDRLLMELRKAGIGTVAYYPTPLHKLPLYARMGYSKEHLPNSEHAAKTVLSLPVHPQVSEEQIAFIAETLKGLLTKMTYP